MNSITLSSLFFKSFLLVIFVQYNHYHIPLNKNVYILIGIIDAVTMIIPGLCGTAIMIMLGCYDVFLNLMMNMNHIIVYGLTVIITILILSKIISYLLTKKQQMTYFAILGFSLGSIFVLIVSLLSKSYHIWEILLGILFLIIGVLLGNIFDR